MRLSKNRIVEIVCAGFIVLVFVSMPLFWARFLCKLKVADLTPRHIRIEPSGLGP